MVRSEHTNTDGGIEARALAWSARADISARSALVTILGDTVAPLGGTVWLNDLIEMAAPFGFNHRLVRTSMFRLVSERWVENERVGRRSRYSLTPFAQDEFATADVRIYGHQDPHWDGEWTIVIAAPGSSFVDLARHLRWRGFAELSRGVYAAPRDDVAGIGQLVEQLDSANPLVATARFDDIAPLADLEPFQATSGLAGAEDAYRDFVDTYQWSLAVDLGSLTDRDAFLVRTMAVHDLRRVRLRDPALPRDLLPSEWSGDQAMTLASTMYQATDDASWRHIETVTGLTVDRTQQLLTNRFPNA